MIKMETIGYFNYEIFDIPTNDVHIISKIFKILLEDFDNESKRIIINSLFNPKDFDKELFAEKFRRYKENKMMEGK